MRSEHSRFSGASGARQHENLGAPPPFLGSRPTGPWLSAPLLRCVYVCVAGKGGGCQQFSVYYLFILNFPTLNCLQFKPKLFSLNVIFLNIFFTVHEGSGAAAWAFVKKDN